jgi:O-antigen ligase
MVYMAFASVMTSSKGGLISLLFMFCGVLLLLHPRTRKSYPLSVIVFLVSMLVLFVIQSMLMTLSPRVLQTQEMSLSTRFTMWSHGMEQLGRHNFIYGLGLGGFKFYLKPLPHAHNLYLSVLFDFGLIGLALYLWFLTVLIKRSITFIRKSGEEMQGILITFAGGLAAILLHGNVDFEYNTPVIWLYLGIMIAGLRIAQREMTPDTALTPNAPV